VLTKVSSFFCLFCIYAEDIVICQRRSSWNVIAKLHLAQSTETGVLMSTHVTTL